ncbi:hypothetical protein [Persicitalea jodogahamensis]|uniref:Uncharacterized protein n=1 Tax=Persicitalea jodogahamensis TaxID=402147 RepID=A0A8J3GA63_9BACT|nr:hypothetical protein [Persicitalea jodogahamensis]GHB70203.1 hypothetical protein GCM10007390_24780 [Persicitalea jodogahamensis]
MSHLPKFTVYAVVLCLVCGCGKPLADLGVAGKVVGKDNCRLFNGKQAWIVDVDASTVINPKNQKLTFSSGIVNGKVYNNLIRVYSPFNEKDTIKKIAFFDLNLIEASCDSSSIEMLSYETDGYGEYN